MASENKKCEKNKCEKNGLHHEWGSEELSDSLEPFYRCNKCGIKLVGCSLVSD